MGRGFVYPSPQAKRPADAAPLDQPAPPPGRESETDGYKDKLLKYIPGEVLAFFIPAAATIGTEDDAWLVAAFLLGAVGTFVYLRIENRKVPAPERAKWWTYLLALCAFTAWALGTSPATADLIDLKEKYAGFILLFAAFLIPAVDALLTKEPQQGK